MSLEVHENSNAITCVSVNGGFFFSLIVIMLQPFNMNPESTYFSCMCVKKGNNNHLKDKYVYVVFSHGIYFYFIHIVLTVIYVVVLFNYNLTMVFSMHFRMPNIWLHKYRLQTRIVLTLKHTKNMNLDQNPGWLWTLWRSTALDYHDFHK